MQPDSLQDRQDLDRRTFLMRSAVIAAATVEPAFLDSLAAKPEQTFQVKLGDKTDAVSLKDIIYDAPKGSFPHPNTMTCASNEIPAHRRVDFDTTVAAMALTAKEMNSKYKETSEGGLAVSLTLC